MIALAALHAIGQLTIPLTHRDDVEVWKKVECSVYALEIGEGSKGSNLLNSAIEEAIPLYHLESERLGEGGLNRVEQHGYEFYSGYSIGSYFSNVRSNMANEIFFGTPEVARDGLRFASLMQQMAEERYEERNCDALLGVERD